ncbi:MAG: hypothetical protein GX604_06370 [Actinobacteria bacterium]|nr:hypothetical protein [Actinomycetota bacterium]
MDDDLQLIDFGQDIHALTKKLASTHRVFHSEADFQHALAWFLHGEIPNAEIRLEHRVPGMDLRSYLDIWLTVDGQVMAMELKGTRRGG